MEFCRVEQLLRRGSFRRVAFGMQQGRGSGRFRGRRPTKGNRQRGGPWIAGGMALALLTASSWAATGLETQAASGARSPVTITFWNWWDGVRVPIMTQVIKEFQKRYPWITVKSQVQGWSDVTAKALSAFAAGAPPDVLMTRRAEIMALADLGAVRPIDELVAQDELDLSIFYPAEIDAFRYNGRLWSLPLPTVTANDDFYFYNREMFDAAGLDADRPPETWSTLLETNRKLTRRDDAGAITQLGVRAWPSQFIPFLYSNDGRFLSPDLRKVTFAGPEGRAAAQLVGDLAAMNNGAKQRAFLARYETGVAAAFIRGREGMLFENVSVMNPIIQDAIRTGRKLDWWGVGFIPYNDKNPKARSTGVAGLSYGWGYVIPKTLTGDRLEAAWLWVRFLTTDPMGAGVLMFAQGRPAPIRALNQNPDYRKLNPNWDRLLQAMETDVAFPAIPIQNELMDAVVNRFWAVSDGSTAPDEALAKAAEAAQKALDQYWARRKS